MIEFVIGGTAQGKLKYVLDKNNLTKEDVCNGEECAESLCWWSRI